jgi:hypothetical protein
MARAFTDPGQEPTLEAAEAIMADLGTRFRGLLRRTSGLSSVWTFSKGSGWLLKIQDRRKALCYVIPHDRGFVIRGTVRETERKALSQVGVTHQGNSALRSGTSAAARSRNRGCRTSRLLIAGLAALSCTAALGMAGPASGATSTLGGDSSAGWVGSRLKRAIDSCWGV